MSGTDYTVVGLLAEIRRRGRIPTELSDFTDAELLLQADTALRETFIPLVMRMRADFYLRSEDQTIVEGTQNYALPARAMLNSLRKVEWIDGTGIVMEVYPIPQTDVGLYAGSTGTPLNYAIQDDVLVLVPSPISGLGTLRVWYEYRPAKLVSSGYFVVESVTSTTVTLTAAVTYTAASRYDFVKSTSPFSLIGADADPTGTGTGVTLTFPAGTIPSRLAAGDYMCLPNESPVAQLPGEMHSTLALAVAVEVLLQTSPDEGAQKDGQLQRALQQWSSVLVPRGRGRQIKQYNRNSAIRRGHSVRRSSNLGP